MGVVIEEIEHAPAAGVVIRMRKNGRTMLLISFITVLQHPL